MKKMDGLRKGGKRGKVNVMGNDIGNGNEFLGVEDGDVEGLINGGQPFVLGGVDEVRRA